MCGNEVERGFQAYSGDYRVSLRCFDVKHRKLIKSPSLQMAVSL